MVDDSVLALCAKEPHWRIADCPQPALCHDGYRPELLSAGNKANRLRRAMEQELREHPGDPYASAKLAGLEISEGRTGSRPAAAARRAGPLSEQAHPERYELAAAPGDGRSSAAPEQAISHYRQALALPLDPRLSFAAQAEPQRPAAAPGRERGRPGTGRTGRPQRARSWPLAGSTWG